MKIVNNGTLQEWNIRSNEVGVYSITAVPAGQCDVTAAVTGFQTQLKRGVPMAANNTMRIAVGLKVGAVAETIAVSAAATVLQTDIADGTLLNAPGNAQLADQVKVNVQILGARDSWFDPLAFVPVTET